MVTYRYLEGITHFIFVDDSTNQYVFSIHVEFVEFNANHESYKLGDLMKERQDVIDEFCDSFNKIVIRDGSFDGVILVDRVPFNKTNEIINDIVKKIKTDEDLRRVVNEYIMKGKKIHDDENEHERTSPQIWHY